MIKPLTYIAIIIMVCSCKQAEYNHEAPKSNRVFVEETHAYPEQTNTIHLISDSEVDDISISGIFGNTRISHLIKDGQINIDDIPASIRNTAGRYQLLASLDNLIVDKSELYIQAGEIVGKSTNFLGPKTTPFEDKEGALITGYFQDSNNNLVDTILNLQFNTQIDASLKQEIVETNHEYFFSHRIKPVDNKRQLVGIKSGSQFSDEMTVIGSSGCPITGEISIDDMYDIADGRQLFTVMIDEFFDEGRNQIANGTALSLLFQSKDYSSTYSGQVVNGQVRFLVQNPHLAGTYRLLVKSCNETIAQSKALYFKPSLQDIHYSISGNTVNIGPVLSKLNQIIPNGTPVQIRSNQCDNKDTIQLELEEAYASIELSELDRDCRYIIQINGIERELIINQ